MKPIIDSLLENDLYKFTMWQAMLHRSPQVSARYEFVCRNEPEFPLSMLEDQVNGQLDDLCTLRFQPKELEYLRYLRYIKSDFVDFLSLFHFRRDMISVSREGGTLKIIAEGPQIHIMGFEIPVLSIVNELYFKHLVRTGPYDYLVEGRKRLQSKIQFVRDNTQSKIQFVRNNTCNLRHPFEFFDFGLRRRFSKDWQAEVDEVLLHELPEHFKGTSNVYLAKKLGITPIGTMAHEYLQTYQALNYRLRDFQKEALEGWVQEYRGDLGYALTDTIGMDAFLRDFDLYFTKLFDGLRHDSGDPYKWAHKALDHYKVLRIDPHTKRLTFSDGLTITKALNIYREFGDQCQLGFGIGTNLTNDVGHTPLNIVMKLTQCNGQPVAKISDAPGKTLCKDEKFIAYLKQVFEVKE